MPREPARTFLLVLLAAVTAAACGHFWSATAGWGILCGSLLLQMAHHLRNFMRLDRWSRAPGADASFEGSGNWDRVFGRLYRHEKNNRARIEQRDRHIDMLFAAIQALNDGIVLTDSKDRIVFCNTTAESMLGLKAETDNGQVIVNLVRQPEFVAYLGAADYARPMIFRPERRPGRTLSIQIIPYADDRKLLQIKDITQSEQLDRMRRDFVANVSHELRTPLTVLSGFLETLRELDLPPEEQRRHLATMAEQSTRMQNIVQDLLTLSSIESAPPPVDNIVDMTWMLDKLRHDAESLSAGNHRLIFATESCADLRGSEAELVSAFSNLITNAIRYTPAGGTITVRWQSNAQGGDFSVQDTGVGIEARHIPRLTERFYRVDRGRSREAGGTGLGLAIVKHALGRHQADLTIESTLGVGSRFTAHFPANRLATPASQASERPPLT